jgi:RNA polymerase primary sigma factor
MRKTNAAVGKKINSAQKEEILKLIAKGKEQGFLTYDEINSLITEDFVSPDNMDDLLKRFNEEINPVNG